MGKYTVLRIILGVGVGIGIVSFFVGFVLMLFYLPPFWCGGVNDLSPGAQSACDIEKGKFPAGTVEVEIRNDDIAGARIETYVFNKPVNRSFVPETYNLHLEDESGRYRYYYLPAVKYAEYTIVIDSNEEIDLKYQYRSGKTTFVLYSADDIQHTTLRFNISEDHTGAYFYVKCPSSTEGKFQITVKWPRYVWGPKDYVMSCQTYPCEFQLSDPKLADHDLLFVTINNGNGMYSVYTSALEKFVVFLLFHDDYRSLFFFTVILFVCLNSMSVWIPATVVPFVGGFVLALGCGLLLAVVGEHDH